MGTVMRVRRSGTAAADRVWNLFAEPACWPAWAPHMRHVTTVDGGPCGRISPGDRIRIHTPVPRLGITALITAVDAPRSWAMRVNLPVLGTVTSTHLLADDARGTSVTVELGVEGGIPGASRVLGTYRPLLTHALRRLLRVAADDEAGAAGNGERMCGCPPE